MIFLIAALLSTTAQAQTLAESPKASESELQAVIESDKARGLKVAGVANEPSSKNSSSVTFRLDSRRLDPGQVLYLVIPKELREGAVDFAVLSHRQDPAHDQSHVQNYLDYDNTPAYTSVQLLDLSQAKNDQWRYWLGPGSSSFGAKFAEIRDYSNPEIEGLYSWRKLGHGSVYGSLKTTEALHPSMIRLVASGSDPVFIHELQLKFAPRLSPDRLIEKTFTPGTNLGDYSTGVGQYFGGGERQGGTYPSAEIVNDYKSITIDLPKNVKVTSVDVAAGDARGWDSEHGTYFRGGGKLYIRWLRNGTPVQSLVDNENLGPQGLVRGVPGDSEMKTQAGDQIEISGLNTCYIMGYRVGLKD